MSEFFNLYLDYVDQTEPPVIFHRWSAIAAVGALIGRRAWIDFGPFRIFPNIYTMMIGDPGTRKSTAIKLARKVCSTAGFNSFAHNRTSKEKFLLDLEGSSDDSNPGEVVGSAVMEQLWGTSADCGEPKEVFIVADEFNDFLGNGGLEFLSLLGSLWDWDDEDNPFTQRLKNSKSIAIYQPTISLLAGNTHTGLAQAFPPEALGQGFMSRLILVFSEPSGIKIAFPEVPPESKKQKLVEIVQRMQTEIRGQIEISSKAREILEVIYRSKLRISDDSRFTSYTSRRFTHLLKLCLIVAAASCSRTILVEHVLMANTVLSYTEHFMPNALGEFGKARNSDINNKVINFLLKEKKPVDFPEVWKQVRNDFEKQTDLQNALIGMQQAGLITWVKTPTVRGWLAVKKVLDNRELYVDYSLLKEYNKGAKL